MKVQDIVDAFAKVKTKAAAAIVLGISRGTLNRYLAVDVTPKTGRPPLVEGEPDCPCPVDCGRKAEKRNRQVVTVEVEQVWHRDCAERHANQQRKAKR